MSDLIKLEEIDNIKNFMEGMDILGERDLIIDGISDVDDIKEILRLKYYPKVYEDALNARKSLLYQKYSFLKDSLKKQLQNVIDIIKHPLFQKEFGEIYKISEERIMDKQAKLEELIKRESFPILTAGEAKAGKSTLINLLLGTELMPMDLVTCTRMICEVRNSQNRRATFVVDEKDHSKDYVVSLGEDAKETISRIVKQEDAVNYKKGKFEYPVEFLDEFTFLVDSPGIGDTTPLEKITFDFLNKNSPAFIFVLNATNSNGLNLKAKELIKKARDELTKDSSCFITDEVSMKPNKYSSNEIDKAIFILNHWDVVRANAKSKDEVEEVRRTIINEIQCLWHSSAVEGVQIFFISALQARQWMKHGLIQTDLIKLRQSLTNLVVKLYERNFLNCLGLLDEILDYIERKILLKINTNVDNKYCRLYDKRHAEALCSVLIGIIANSDKRKEKISENLKPKFILMVKSLTDHLKSDIVETRVLEISRSKINVEKNIDFLTIVLKKVLENQLYEELKIWEKESSQIQALYSYLNDLFENHLIQISNEINIDNMLINQETLLNAWNSSNHKEMRKLDNAIITKIEQVFIITTITLLFPVVAIAGLLATPLIVSYILKEKRANIDNLKKYESDPDGYLRKIIKDSLGNLSENDVSKYFFKNLHEKCSEHIQAFDTFIKAELSEKRQLIKEIENESRDMPDILRCLNNLLGKIEKCYGNYHLLKNEYLPDESLIRRSSFYLRPNETMPEKSELIYSSKSSIVFRSQRHPNILFKMYNQKFSQQFARFQMQELDILSTAPCAFILRLKHICYLKEEEKLLLVLENAECNLYTFLSKNTYLIPTFQNINTPEWEKAFRFIVDVCKQLCICLDYIHTYDVRMVHPDLNLETVLVSTTDLNEKINIFIVDACSNLPTQRFHKASGNQQCQQMEHYFDMGGYTKENIYRLGIIFYKMVYFECKTSVLTLEGSIAALSDDNTSDFLSRESLDDDINIDWNEEKHRTIPDDFNELIKICISRHPQDRPSAKHCLEKLASLKI